MVGSNSILSREALAGYDPQRLSEAVVVDVGAGALGQNVLLDITLSGVHEIRVIDLDIFEASNSTRSPFYGGKGAPKAKSVAEGLYRARPLDSQRIRYAQASVQELGEGAFDGANVIISAVDSAEARSYVDASARRLGIPLIEGGFHGPEVTVSVYANNPAEASETPCWRCANPNTSGSVSCKLYAQQLAAESKTPAIQAGAAFLAAIMAEQAVQCLHGGSALAGVSVDLNVRTGESRRIRHARDPLCQGPHRSYGEVQRLSTTPSDTVAQLLFEIGGLHLAEEPAVEIVNPFVFEIPCRGCNQMTRFSQPVSAWLLNGGICSECGGPTNTSTCKSDLVRIYSRLTSDIPAEILDLTCSAIGLNFGSLVEVADHDDQLVALALQGGPDELFTDISQEEILCH